MKLRIIVEVVDEETSKGTRRRREIEIPKRVLNINKTLCESRRDLRAFVADDVMSGALGTILGQQSGTDRLGEALLMEPSPQSQPSSQSQPQPHGGSPQPIPQKAPSKIESFLGLDVIEHMDGVEAQVTRAEQVQEAQTQAQMIAAGQAPPPKFEWGSLGFGPDRGK
jgi:hypothetical protein